MRNIWREPQLGSPEPAHLPESQMLLLEASCLLACHLGPMMPSKRTTTEWEGNEQSIFSHPRFLIVWHGGRRRGGGLKSLPTKPHLPLGKDHLKTHSSDHLQHIGIFHSISLPLPLVWIEWAQSFNCVVVSENCQQCGSMLRVSNQLIGHFIIEFPVLQVFFLLRALVSDFGQSRSLGFRGTSSSFSIAEAIKSLCIRHS